MTKDLESKLLAWYDAQGRHLPWRDDPTPYHVWLSEIMLQQTRIEAVKEYYARFLKAFPTVEALASASEEEVLKLWEGLGYYSRARNLKKAAEQIVERGGFPKDAESWRKLPGVGEYTSKSISSIAFSERQVSVDGNLLRVYSRLTADPVSPSDPEAKKKAEEFFLKEIPASRPGDFNQALMDIGELVCLPHGAPLCANCPLKEFCLAHREGTELNYPLPKEKKEKKAVRLSVFLFFYEGKIAIHKRPGEGLLANLYEFPNLEGEFNPKKTEEEFGAEGSWSELGRSTHVFTHLVWEMEWKRLDCLKKPTRGDLQFVKPKELKEKYALPSAFSKFFSSLKID